ncbi:hypothetical protein FPSE_11082 [Fusarium pseudograminearum CS3096]|uniref:Uncharacterized protein n=1 Tax=Fusarium pseudograminearum (strain CS3096) TaxID=1028729 RepID=K3UBF5_FUSPC|nr:hypothetical protein FPSE_11082 [Fusarium pseudograminearum CS3096]EKJ68731.1 hypothetical protein FPSE_11082 [Fusarium pseudograminearum CS3096]
MPHSVLLHPLRVPYQDQLQLRQLLELLNIWEFLQSVIKIV